MTTFGTNEALWYSICLEKVSCNVPDKLHAPIKKVNENFAVSEKEFIFAWNLKLMDNRYDILKSISQREDGTMPAENADLVHVANVIRRATASCFCNETELFSGINIVDVNDAEKRGAEKYAKENNCWIPIADIFSLGIPGPSGSESDTYLSEDGYVYKTNNMLHCADSVVATLNRFAIFNMLFMDSAYTFIGFTGFDERNVYPIVRQKYIKDGHNAMQNEIDCYMAALGFDKVESGMFQNNDYIVWDMFPKNVLKDPTGDIFVIDAEIIRQL